MMSSTETQRKRLHAGRAELALQRELIDAAIAVNEAPTLDEACQVLAETGLVLLGCDRLAVVSWNADVSGGVIRGDTGPARGLAADAAPVFARLIRSETPYAGAPQPEGFPESVMRSLETTAFVVRVPLVTASGISTFHALWNSPLSAEEADAATEILRLLTRLTSIAERSRRDRQQPFDAHSGKLAALGELAAGVAHEINNPLFAILALTELLLQDAEPGSTSHERLVLVERTGLEIKQIVRALLDFAREDAEERRIVKLDDVVRSTLDLIRRTNANKDVHLVASYGDGEAQPLVEANANQIKQVVLNLIANARQAMPEGGDVRIRVRREADEAVLVVSDDGPGIEPAILRRIFEPFFSTKHPNGTGLGLSVSKAIAESHGGTLTAASEPGRGATFTFRLPLVDEQRDAHE